MKKEANPLAATTFAGKMTILREAFSDWPKVMLDQLGWVRHLHCRTRTGSVFSCRGGGSDAGRVAVIFSGRAYPPAVLRFEAFPEDATVWDVGAGIGAFSLWMDGSLRKTHGKRVSLVCVESVDECLDLLQENLALNGLGGLLSSMAVWGQSTVNRLPMPMNGRMRCGWRAKRWRAVLGRSPWSPFLRCQRAGESIC